MICSVCFMYYFSFTASYSIFAIAFYTLSSVLFFGEGFALFSLKLPFLRGDLDYNRQYVAGCAKFLSSIGASRY